LHLVGILFRHNVNAYFVRVKDKNQLHLWYIGNYKSSKLHDCWGVRLHVSANTYYSLAIADIMCKRTVYNQLENQPTLQLKKKDRFSDLYH
jgi:hypothetical protein